MFEGLLKSKFYSKCKSIFKTSRRRIEMIMKKRNAMQKYMRNDILELLRNNLDINACGRAEGLIVEMNRSDCYQFVDQFCSHLLSNLESMCKQRECPEECKEAVSSLMYAAARFADLPELRDLRTLFSERYGKSIEVYVNKEFSEKLKSGVSPKQLKLKLLEEIAVGSSLDWCSKALENSLYEKSTRTVAVKDHAKESNYLLPEKHELPPHEDVKVDAKRVVEHKEAINLHKEEKESKEEEHLKYRPPPYVKPIRTESRDDPSPVLQSVPKPTPKSVRTKNPRNDFTPSHEEKKERLNREQAEQGQRVLKFLDKELGGDDEKEEEIMDHLLRHYSRKYAPRRSDVAGGPTRVSSLPTDLTPETSIKGHARVGSFQPEMLKGNGGHVHPKMPDYDEFVARLAELRGKGSEDERSS